MVDAFNTGHVLWSMYLTQGMFYGRCIQHSTCSMVDVFSTGQVLWSMHLTQDMFYGRCI